MIRQGRAAIILRACIGDASSTFIVPKHLIMCATPFAPAEDCFEHRLTNASEGNASHRGQISKGLFWGGPPWLLVVLLYAVRISAPLIRGLNPCLEGMVALYYVAYITGELRKILFSTLLKFSDWLRPACLLAYHAIYICI